MAGAIGRAALALGALGVAAIALAVGVSAFVVPRPAVQGWLKAQVSRALGADASFDSLSLTLLPAPGVRLRGIHIGTSARAASVGSVRVALVPTALLRGEVEVSRVVLERPSLSVTRDASGRWVLDEQLEQLVAAVRSTRRRVAAPGSRAHMPKLEFHDGILDLDDRRVAGGPVSLEIRDLDVVYTPPLVTTPGSLVASAAAGDGQRLEVDLDLDPVAPGAVPSQFVFRARVHGESLSSDRVLLYLLFGLPIRNPGGSFDIDGSVQGSWAGGLVGKAVVAVREGVVVAWGADVDAPVELSASFSVRSGGFSMTGARVTAPDARVDRLQVSQVDGTFDWKAGVLDVHSLALEAYGGEGRATGSVDFRSRPRYRTSVHYDGADFRKLSSVLSERDVHEGFDTASLEANVEGEWTGASDWLGALRGGGSLRFHGGRYDSEPIIRGIFSGLAARIPGIARLSPRETATRPTRLHQLTATVAFADGGVTSRDIALRTEDYHATGSGRVGFDGALKASAEVVFNATGVGRIYAAASLPFRQGDIDSLPPIPVEIGGTLGNPKVVPNLTEISLTPFHALFGGAEGALGRLRDLARPAAQPVERGLLRLLPHERRADAGGDDPPTDGPEAPTAGP